MGNMELTTFGNVGEALLRAVITASIIMIPILIFYIIVQWKIFKKAGEPGWQCLIPIYNSYVQYKIAGVSIYFWISLVVSLIMNLLNFGFLNIILYGVIIYLAISYSINLAKSFGKSAAFGIGIAFLGGIFLPILAFGQAQYIGTKK